MFCSPGGKVLAERLRRQMRMVSWKCEVTLRKGQSSFDVNR